MLVFVWSQQRQFRLQAHNSKYDQLKLKSYKMIFQTLNFDWISCIHSHCKIAMYYLIK